MITDNDNDNDNDNDYFLYYQWVNSKRLFNTLAPWLKLHYWKTNEKWSPIMKKYDFI